MSAHLSKCCFLSSRISLNLKINSPHIYKTLFFSNSVISDFVRVTKQNNLHLIAINRPEKRNCVNSETARQLRTAFKDFEEDQSALVAILHGVGGTFSAGLDLKEIAAGDISHLESGDGPMGPTKMKVKKPVIAAVDGYAVGGGFELALWCDLRVMEDTATMGFFSRRFGVPLIDGGTVRLPKYIGLARAVDIILTGRAIRAKEAYEIGLVSKLCKAGQVLETAVELAKIISECPQDCMNIDTNSTYRNAYDSISLQESFKYEIESATQVFKDAVKGATKFMKGSGRHGESV